MRRGTGLICAVLFVAVTILTGTSAYAGSCEIPGDITISRPDPDNTPTIVAVGVYLIDVSGIDDVKQTFTADVYGTMSWHDARLSDKALGSSLEGCSIELNEIWHPQINIINQRTFPRFYEDTVKIDNEGNVIYRKRFIGEFSSPVDLKDFPFDSQGLNVSLTSFRYGPDEVSFSVDRQRTGRLEGFSITEWSVDLGEPRISSVHIAPQDRDLSRIDFSLIAKRHAGFYLWKVLLPLALIVLMAWTVFWIDPNEVGAQIAISTASVLTLIAFQISFGYLLPRVSYFTRADMFTFGSTILVFYALAEGILTTRLAKAGRQRISLLIDRISRLGYLALLGGLIFFTLFGTNMLNAG